MVIKVHFCVQKLDHVSYGRPRPQYRWIYKMFIYVLLEIFTVEQQKLYLLKRVNNRFISNSTGDVLATTLHKTNFNCILNRLC